MTKNFLLFSLLGLLLIIIIVIMSITPSNNKDEILEVKIIIKDHKFYPDIINVPSGKKIRLIVHNQDNTVEEFESIDLHREKIIMPNKSIHIIIAPLAVGKYEFFGDFHQDSARGVLIVD